MTSNFVRLEMQPFELSREQEEKYRQFYLRFDVAQAKIGLLLFIIPLLVFIFNDYQFLGFSGIFVGTVLVRCCLVVFSLGTAVYLGKVENYGVYEKVVTIATVVLLIGGGVINATRPPTYVVHVLITIISVFVLYLIIYNRFINQVFLATATTVGEAIIVLLHSTPSEGTALFAVLVSLLFANIVGFFSSWQLHSYRRRSFEDLVKRQEAQSKLEEYATNLENIVAERTEELKASERLAAIGATAGMVGHDIRNPLTTITSVVYLSKKKLEDLSDEEVKEALKKNFEVIEEQILYINKIVADLQDYSMPLHPSIKEVEVPVLIQETLANVKVSDDIKVDVQVEDNLLKLKTDPVFVKRILTNLFTNAVQAMPHGGKITLKAALEGNEASISVEDTGQGIPDEVKNKLFKPLVTTKPRGQGFGLVVVKRLVEALGGKVTFESEAGKGAKFTVKLPA